MRQVPLGRTGLTVSEVAFGGIPIQRLSEDDAVAVVRRCLDLGVTFLDTAHGYSTSEERIGKAIAGRRDGLVLATKSPSREAESFAAQMELSFSRLGVDYIDIFQFHNVATQEALDQVLAPGGPYEIAQQARADGRIGHIGVTSHSLDMALKMAGMGLFETLMFPFNYMTDEPAKRLIPLCRDQGIGFIAMKPMAGGMLEDATLSFKYLRQHEGVIPVVGIQEFAEIEEIVGVLNGPIDLTEAEHERMTRIVQTLGDRFCRRCDYCQPCPQGIEISTVLNIKGFARRMPAERVFGGWGRALIARAETCIVCGECASRCPYHLAVPEMLAENAQWYSEQMALRGG
jgi:predicted aldo/keto reductase-like oxidoreductase